MDYQTPEDLQARLSEALRRKELRSYTMDFGIEQERTSVFGAALVAYKPSGRVTVQLEFWNGASEILEVTQENRDKCK